MSVASLFDEIVAVVPGSKDPGSPGEIARESAATPGAPGRGDLAPPLAVCAEALSFAPMTPISSSPRPSPTASPKGVAHGREINLLRGL